MLIMITLRLSIINRLFLAHCQCHVWLELSAKFHAVCGRLVIQNPMLRSLDLIPSQILSDLSEHLRFSVHYYSRRLVFSE